MTEATVSENGDGTCSMSSTPQNEIPPNTVMMKADMPSPRALR